MFVSTIAITLFVTFRPKTAPPTRSHLKTLRELRAARKNKNENTTVSIQQKKKVEDAHTYLAVNVDPIFSKAITYILIEQPTPDALLRTLLNYFNNLVAGNEIKPTSAEKQQRKVQSTDKLFMAKALSPVFTKLINMALALRPDDVPCFVVDTLNDMIKEQEERELKLAEEELKASNEKIAAANAGKGEASDNGNDNEKRESRITPKEEGSVNEAVAEEAAVEKVYPKKMVVLVLGIENSGKSTLLKVVQGDEDPKMAPTVGFNPASLKLGKSTVQFYDIGGGPKIRDIWSSYYHDVHGIIYVVDSASDDMKFAEACEVAKTTLSHQYLAGKPLLFLCNKAEAPAARDVEEIKDDMDLVVPPGGNVLCTSITLHPQHTQDKGMDPRIDSSLEWLFDCVAGDFENIKVSPVVKLFFSYTISVAQLSYNQLATNKKF